MFVSGEKDVEKINAKLPSWTHCLVLCKVSTRFAWEAHENKRGICGRYSWRVGQVFQEEQENLIILDDLMHEASSFPEITKLFTRAGHDLSHLKFAP